MTLETPPTGPFSLARNLPIPLTLGIAAGVASYVAAGASLGLYFAGVAIVTIVLPPLTAAETRQRAAIIAAAFCGGVSIIWLLAALGVGGSILQWLSATLTLVAYT